MQPESLANALLLAINPALRMIIRRFDIDCGQDGNLLMNSLKAFFSEDVELCRTCESLNRKLATPLFEISSKLMRADRSFMKDRFLDQKYGDAWLKGFALIVKGIEKYGIHIPFVPAGPVEVVWNFTYLCNLKCVHCYEDAGSHRPELSTEQALMVIDKLSNSADVGLPALSFSGGEPLARQGFFEVLAYANKKIPYLSVATNGTLLTKDNAKQLKEVGVEYVEISLDGASKKVHERFRGVSGCFEKTMDGIRNCLDEGLDTCIATTAHRDNLAEFSKIMDLAEELQVRFMHFNYIPTGRAKELIELDLSPKERLLLLETMGEKLVSLYLKAKDEEEKSGKSYVAVDRVFSTCPQFASVVKKLSMNKGENFTVSAHYAAKRGVEAIANFLGGCGAGRLYIALEPNGDIKPCVFFPTNAHTVIGNILKDDFFQIWDDDPMLWSLRKRENLETHEIGGQIAGCGNCKDKYICGGCRARSYSYFGGNLNAADIGCINNEEIWKKVVKSS